jgi:hypothetical protein
MTQAFNLSQFANQVNTSGQADLTTAVTGTLPVVNGGTNQTTYTNGQLLIGNTTGNTLTKSTLTAGSGVTITNGAGSITIAAASAANIQSQVFTSPGTWTCPASTTQVRVAVFGGSSGSIWNSNGGAGGTSSFGSVISATGGGGGNNNHGSGTVSSGTTLKTGALNTLGTGLTAISLITGPGTGNSSNGTPPTAYSITSGFFAGSGPGVTAPQRGSSGGFALGIVPVSAPVSVTVGAGGTAPPPSGNVGGMGGAVVVEWVA